LHCTPTLVDELEEILGSNVWC